MVSREQVRELLDGGLDYEAAGKRLGIPGEGTLPASRHLANPPNENPASSGVRRWIAARVAADQPMRDAAARRTAEPGPPKAEDPENPEAAEFSRDVTVVLTRQHNQVRALLVQLQATPSGKTGGAAEDLSARKSIVDMIAIRLSQHEMAEEKYFWPAVRKVLANGDELADEALRQEQEGTQTLARLGGLAPDSDRFDEGVEQLVAELRKHVAYEEFVFARLREAMPQAERERLGRRLESAGTKRPARPHRRAPGEPGVGKAAEA